MLERYTVHYLGPLTAITSTADGPWPRWEMARAAAIEHLESHVAECERTLECLRRAGCFWEDKVLMGEITEAEADEVAQVQGGSTLL